MTKVLTDQRSIRIKGRSFLAVVLSPESPVDQWLERLDDLAARSAGFFLSRPVVLDVSELSLDKAGLKELLAALRERNVGIMGIEGVRPSMIEPGMPPSLKGGKPASDVEVEPVAVAAELPEDKPHASGEVRAVVQSLVINEPVRSGQSIMFPEGDVTVIGSVASGAEIIAGGSVHIYGALRGRAMAGSLGNVSARIFCRKLAYRLCLRAAQPVGGRRQLLGFAAGQLQATIPVDHHIQFTVTADGKMRRLDRVGMGHVDDHHRSPHAFAGLDARGRIFEDDAAFRRNAEPFGGLPVTFGIGLAVDHIVGADHHGWRCDAGRREPFFRQFTHGGGDDSPFSRGQRRKKVCGARYRNDALHVIHLGAQDHVGLGIHVQAGNRLAAYYLGSPHAMDTLQKCVRLDTVCNGPLPPDALDNGNRIDQRSVHVEQEGRELLRKYLGLRRDFAVHLILPLELSGIAVSTVSGDITESLFGRQKQMIVS